MPSRDDIVLIGPVQAGKSTVANLLSATLGWPVVSLDEICGDYYREIGYDRDEADRLEANGGFRALYEYWKPFEIHAVERVLAEHADRGSIFDLGAGHAVYEDPALFARAVIALAPYRHIVLLLPAADPDECLRVLEARLDHNDPGRAHDVVRDLNRHLIEHRSFRELATLTVFNADQTPEATCREILSVTGLSVRRR